MRLVRASGGLLLGVVARDGAEVTAWVAVGGLGRKKGSHQRRLVARMQLRMRVCCIHVLEASHLVHLELLRRKVAVLIRSSVVRELRDLALRFVLRLVVVLLASRLADAVTISSSIRTVVTSVHVLGDPLADIHRRRDRSPEHLQLVPIDLDELALVIAYVDVLRLRPLRRQDLNALHRFLDDGLANVD